MSKLYNMIEDALMKKGLTVPSDSFIFNADKSIPEDNLDKKEIKDDIYAKDQNIEDKDLKLKEDEEEFMNHFMKIYDDYYNNKLKQYEKDINDSEKEYEDLSANLDPNDQEAVANLKDTSKAILFLKNSYETFKNQDREVFKDWLNNLNQLNGNTMARILLYPADKLMYLYDKTKPQIIETSVEYKDTGIGNMGDITGNFGKKSNNKADKKLNVAKYDPNYTFSKEKLVKLTGDKDLEKEYMNYEYPYDISTIQQTPWRQNLDIISVQANKNKVEEVLRANDIDTDFMYGTFDFDDEHNNPIHKCTIAGVPANPDEQNPLQFVYLQEWLGEKENAIYKRDSKYIKVPVNMVRRQLVGQTPNYENNMPSNLENKGEYWPLTPQQVERVLLQCMYDYAMGRSSEPIFANDLLKIFRSTPDAKIIKDALAAFVPGRKILRNTQRGTITYYVFIPYVQSNNRLDTGGNPELRTFNKLAGQ